MSNFFFPNRVFYPFGELSAILIKIKIVVCLLCQFESLKIIVWERVNTCANHFPNLNSLTNGKSLDWTKVKSFADDQFKVQCTSTESCFRHPLFDLRGTRKVEIRHTNFHFSSKKVTSKSRKVEVFDLTIVKKLSTFRPKKAKVEKLKSRKVEKSNS